MKMAHFKLIHGLRKHSRRILFVGNTSGLLDEASMMGHNVINFHKSTTPINDTRILLQIVFSKVVRRRLYEKYKGQGLKDLMDEICTDGGFHLALGEVRRVLIQA